MHSYQFLRIDYHYIDWRLCVVRSSNFLVWTRSGSAPAAIVRAPCQVAFPGVSDFSLKNRQNPPAPGSRKPLENRDASIQDFPCREIRTGTELTPSSVAVLACTGSPRGAFPPHLLIWKIFQINRYPDLLIWKISKLIDSFKNIQNPQKNLNGFRSIFGYASE